MVYCDYIKHNENIVEYAYGGKTDDISGRIKFNIDGSSFEIVEEPKRSTVYLRSLYRLFNKYKSDFSKRKFNEKLSYEC